MTVTNVTSRKRVRRTEVTEDEWTRHRKLRKKMASAKWYAKKKEAEIEEENRLRQHLAVTLLPKPDDYVWPDPMVRWHWHAAMDCMLRGFPERPTRVPVDQWVTGTRCVEDWLRYRLPYTGERGCMGCHIPWDCPRFGRTWRAVAMGEWMEAVRSNLPCTEVSWWTCSVVGAAYVAWHLLRTDPSYSGQGSLPSTWGEVARAITHVATISTTIVHTHANPLPHNQPPNQKPRKNTDRLDMNDPPVYAEDWCQFVCWMNHTLFDPCTCVSDDVTTTSDRSETLDWPSQCNDHTDNDDTESNPEWMDAYLEPFLDCTTPLPLDHSQHDHPYAHSGYPIYGAADPSSYHSFRSIEPTNPETTCDHHWISDPSDPPSINGNEPSDVPDPGNPTSPW